MNTRLLGGIVLVALVAGLGLSKQKLYQHHEESTASDQDVLQSVLYEHFFRWIEIQDPIDIKTKTGLGEEDMSVLRILAQECRSEIDIVDERAKPVIDELRTRAAKAKRKEDLPQPPKLLEQLQHDRNAIALRQRDTLRRALGNQKFERVNEFAKKVVKIEIIMSPEK